MSDVQLRNAVFLRAVARISELPADRGREVAFAGRSNAGKSTAINAITGRKSLARTSKTPGRTQQIVFFDLDANRRLVDLPGYGYARVPDKVRRSWSGLVEGYLAARRSLKGVVLLTDARRPFTELDRQLVDWCAAASVPVLALLTKCDKLSRSQAAQALAEAERFAGASTAGVSVQLFSALERQGLDAAAARVSAWLEG